MSHDSRDADAPATGTPRRSLLRNPFVWAFLIGIVTITALRPVLRRVPEPPPVLGELPAWTLVDQRGESFGSAELAGRPYVAGFFFTRCPSICPMLMDAMTRLQDRYDRDGIEDVRMVSISVDPENDTPDRLAEYGAAIGVDFDRWTLLTGEPSAVRELIEGGFKLAMGAAVASDAGVFDIAHSGRLVLVDGRGRVRGYYDVLERDDRYPGYSDPIDIGVDEVFHRSRHVLAERQREPS